MPLTSGYTSSMRAPSRYIGRAGPAQVGDGQIGHGLVVEGDAAGDAQQPGRHQAGQGEDPRPHRRGGRLPAREELGVDVPEPLERIPQAEGQLGDGHREPVARLVAGAVDRQRHHDPRVAGRRGRGGRRRR